MGENGFHNHYKVGDILPHIPGSGGIITVIARRVGCAWGTIRKHINDSPTLEKAYQDELESALDVAENIIFDNIRLARNEQAEGKKIVDSGDARWFLATKGKGRGFTQRTEVDARTTVKGEMVIRYENDWRSPESEEE